MRRPKAKSDAVAGRALCDAGGSVGAVSHKYRRGIGLLGREGVYLVRCGLWVR
jgi:hypothetical protein